LASAGDVLRAQRAQEKIVDNLDEKHSVRLQGVLDRLEDEVEKIVGASALTPSEAIAKRVEIETAMRGTFLTYADESVREYDDIASGVVKMMERIGALEGFVAGDAEVIAQLKRIAFSGYQDIGARFVDTLANGLYQNVLAGRPRAEIVKEMKEAINGVFVKSDDAEAQRLIEFIKENQFNPDKYDEVQEATELLRTQYARAKPSMKTKTGVNLRRYAYQQVHDSIMQFNGSFTQAKAQEAGLNHYQYFGSLVRDSRPFCQEHVGEVMSEERIRELWGSEDWAGKAPGDPFVVRGGYNCRHHFIPVDPDWIT